MIKILFVCHGNICRSPIAQYVMQDLVRREGLESGFYIDSAATSSEETGNPVYPPARRILAKYQVPCGGHRARRMEQSDYKKYDYLVGMEGYNLRNMMRILGDDPEDKVSLLLDWTDRPGDIDDPWYTGDFETVYRQIRQGCEAMLRKLTGGKA